MKVNLLFLWIPGWKVIKLKIVYDIKKFLQKVVYTHFSPELHYKSHCKKWRFPLGISSVNATKS